MFKCVGNTVDLSKSFIKAEAGRGLFGIKTIPDNAIVSINNVLKVILESPDKVFYIAELLETRNYKLYHMILYIIKPAVNYIW